MRFITLLFSLLFLASPAHAFPCATVKEARGEAFMGFLTYQSLGAGLCEKTGKWPGTIVLEKRVRSKFKAQIDDAHQVREGLFRRRYGGKWQANLKRIDQRFTEILLSRIRIDYGVCFNMQSELSRQIAEDWEKRLHDHRSHQSR